MGNRQRKSEELRWLRTHRRELMLAGVPESVLQEPRAWVYVLLHGDDHLGSGWDLTWISDDQARDLFALLRTFYEEPVGLDLIEMLERRLHRTG